MTRTWSSESLFANLTDTGHANTNHFGWIAGAGGEWRLNSNLFVRLEYLHYDLGNTTHTFAIQERSVLFCVPVCTFDRSVNGSLRVDVVRGGLSFKL